MEKGRLVRPFILGMLFRTTDGLVAELDPGFPADVFEGRASRVWRFPKDQPRLFVHNDAVRGVYQVDTLGRATRCSLAARGLDRTLAGQALTRMLTYLGQPDATAGTVGGPDGPDAVSIWRRPGRLLAVEFRPEADGTYTMLLNVISDADPRFAPRAATGGLPRWHPHAPAVQAQLAAPTTPAPSTPSP